MLCTLFSCSDDEFSTSKGLYLQFSTDTLKMDTVFSNVPTSTRTFWVHNPFGDGIRIKNVRLAGGNQNGFRVHVDGTPLNGTAGYQAADFELRRRDSLRVFVELTSPVNGTTDPKLLEDLLVFTLENGRQQQVVLRAYAWDAVSLRNLRIKNDTTLSTRRPVVIYGGIKVDSLATLTIAAGTTLYFHAGAGIEVDGRLLIEGTANANVVLRGDRLDRMFPYLPYDRVSGQWKGILLRSSSYGNRFRFADIHSCFDGVVADSSDVSQLKLTMESSTIHNCQGYGLSVTNSQVFLQNCQFSNTQAHCVHIDGGRVQMKHCTLAQFYPFNAHRGAALWLSAARFALTQFSCLNTLVTGYGEDVLQGEKGDGGLTFDCLFDHCILRTPKTESEGSVVFHEVVFEDVADTTSYGRKHFVRVDEGKQQYDFRLSKQSKAIDCADPAHALPTDRNGRPRDAKPDVGAYEF